MGAVITVQKKSSDFEIFCHDKGWLMSLLKAKYLPSNTSEAIKNILEKLSY